MSACGTVVRALADTTELEQWRQDLIGHSVGGLKWVKPAAEEVSRFRSQDDARADNKR